MIFSILSGVEVIVVVERNVDLFIVKVVSGDLFVILLICCILVVMYFFGIVKVLYFVSFFYYFFYFQKIFKLGYINYLDVEILCFLV